MKLLTLLLLILILSACEPDDPSIEIVTATVTDKQKIEQLNGDTIYRITLEYDEIYHIYKEVNFIEYTVKYRMGTEHVVEVPVEKDDKFVGGFSYGLSII